MTNPDVAYMLSDTASIEQLEQSTPLPEEQLAPVAVAAERVTPVEAGAEVAAVAEAASDSLPVPEPQLPAPPSVQPPAAATATEPPPEEAEAALEALLADVSQQVAPALETEPSLAANAARPSSVKAALTSLPAPKPTSPMSTVRPGRPGGGVTPIPADQRPAASGAATSGTRLGLNQVAAPDRFYRIQLAAMWEEADARRARDLFRVDFGPALSGLEPIIERADTANGVLYRVQIGSFTSLQEAEALCDQLKQRNASCFVIRR